MKWLETIDLRTADTLSDLVLNELTGLINELSQTTQQNNIKIYVHASLKSDFSIHLVHNSEPVKKYGTDLGVFIASRLKTYGLVNHNIWIETFNSELGL